MVTFFGDFDTTETIYIPFNTFTSDDPAASSTITNLVAGDVEIHKDGGLTQRSSDAGVTVTVNFDSVTGNHLIAIDLSDNTDAGFYANGSQYAVRIEGTTVDAGTVNAWVGAFSIGRTLRPATAGRTVVVDANGLVDANTVKVGPTGSGTAQTANDNGADINAILVDTGTTLDDHLTDIKGTGFVKDTHSLIDIETYADLIDDGTSGLAKIATDVAAILVDTGTTLDTNISAILTDTGTTLDNHLTDIKGTGFVKDTHSLVDIEAYADLIDDGTSGLAKIATDVAAILVDTGTTLQAELDAIQAATITNAAGVDIAADIIAVKAETAAIVNDTDLIDDATSGLAKIATDVAAVLVDTGTTIPGTITTIDDFLDTEVAAILALLDDPRTEPGQGAPPVNPDLATKIDYLYKAWRNKKTTDADSVDLYNDDASTVGQTATLSDDGTTFTQGEFGSGA